MSNQTDEKDPQYVNCERMITATFVRMGKLHTEQGLREMKNLHLEAAQLYAAEIEARQEKRTA